MPDPDHDTIHPSNPNTVNILIAEDNDISRELMASILQTQSFHIIPARDGEEAIEAIGKRLPDLALVDLNMEPKGGFSFIQHLIAHGIDVPVVIITADESSDVLLRAQELGVTRVLQKPVEPDRLISITKSILKRYGHNIESRVSQTYESRYSPNQLMQRAIDLAERNAKSLKGGPFGALVSSKDGKILGEGVNGITSRVDPTAHAEIMAIRQAAEKLGRSDLSNCVLYCSSEPTMMGKALIISVGIKQVYFGLTHENISKLQQKEARVRAELERREPAQTQYSQLGYSGAMTMFKRWQEMKDKLSD
ncbi:MAG: response regulator [Alphaproteobacteria bacterium]